jgi:hypothetical protein
MVNGVSYFLRSDGYGLVEVNDGIVRFGWPFIMSESGGVSYYSRVSILALVGNVFVAGGLTIAIAGIRYLVSRPAGPNSADPKDPAESI